MRTNRMFLLLITATLALATIACQGFTITLGDRYRDVQGSGNIVTETYALGSFERIELIGAGRLEIVQDGEEFLTIETDDNLLRYFRVEVRGDTLVVECPTQPNLSLDYTRLDVTLHMQHIEEIEASGAWEISAETIEAETLAARISGAGSLEIGSLSSENLTAIISGVGKMELGGQVVEQHVEISGMGEYLAGNLSSESTNVLVSGAGNVIVWATQELQITVSGASQVDYYGNPQLTLNESAVASVHALGEK